MSNSELSKDQVKNIYSCLNTYKTFFSAGTQNWEKVYALSNLKDFMELFETIYKEKYGKPSLDAAKYIEPTDEAIANRIDEILYLAPWEDKVALNELVVFGAECKIMYTIILRNLVNVKDTDTLSDEEFVLWFRNKTGSVSEKQAIRLLNYIISCLSHSTEDDYDNFYVMDIMNICSELYDFFVDLETLDIQKNENETYIDVMIRHCREIIKAIEHKDGEAAFYHARCIFKVNSVLRRMKDE